MALSSTQIYVNLHVQNVKQSMAFFTELGFEFNMQATIEEKSACIVIGDNRFVMLLREEFFKTITKSSTLTSMQS